MQSLTPRLSITLVLILFMLGAALYWGGSVTSHKPQVPPPLPATFSQTVVLSNPTDPYYPLAEEIAQTETLLLVRTLDEALARNPVFLLWVVSPSALSDRVLSDFGLAMRDRQSAISVGLISGSTEEKARELWQQQSLFNNRCFAAVAREGRISSPDERHATQQPLTRENLLNTLRQADYLIYDGHGTRRSFGLPDKDALLVSADIPPLPPLVVSAGACQTFRLWSEDSIALGFTDRGAAAYAGFVHSPNGYLMGQPDGFPWRYTWPEFPIGHAIQVQNHGLQQGSLYWPFYLLLGDPRLALQKEAPYTLVDDYEAANTRILHFSNAPAGIIPVYIPDAAQYSFVAIPNVAAAWAGDPFYSGTLQMINIGADKYLLFIHRGGDFTVRLAPQPPWYWPVVDPLIDALDHTTVIHHFAGSLWPNLAITGSVLLVIGWLLLRRKVSSAPGTYSITRKSVSRSVSKS